jgi:hypothetical protein
MDLTSSTSVGFTGAVRHRLEGFPVFVVVMSEEGRSVRWRNLRLLSFTLVPI